MITTCTDTNAWRTRESRTFNITNKNCSVIRVLCQGSKGRPVFFLNIKFAVFTKTLQWR